MNPRRPRGPRYNEFDVETLKNPGPDPSTYPALTVGMTVSLMLGVTALLIGLGVGGFVGYFYDRENTRFGDIEDTLASLQAQIDNKTAVTTFPDDLFAIFHGADPSRRFCFDALQIEVGMKRTLTIQDGNGTVAYLADIPVDRAPNDATYLTLSTDAELTSERVLVMDAGNFDTSDFGPNAAFVVDLSDTGVVADTYTRATIEVDSKGRILSASSNAAGNISTGSFLDDMFMVLNAIDDTKIVMLDVSGVDPFTTRTMTIPNLDGILALTSGTQTFTDKTLVGSTNTIEASAVRTTGAAVVFSGAAPPVAGQLPTATGPGAITWQTGATAVQTTGSPVDFSTAAPPTVGQIPVFDGISAINWENITASNVAEFLGTAATDVNVGLSAQPGGSGFQLITTSSTVAAWTSVPVVSSGVFIPVATALCGINPLIPAVPILRGQFLRIGNRVNYGFHLRWGTLISTAAVSFTVTAPLANFGSDVDGSAVLTLCYPGFWCETGLRMITTATPPGNLLVMTTVEVLHGFGSILDWTGQATYVI